MKNSSLVKSIVIVVLLLSLIYYKVNYDALMVKGLPRFDIIDLLLLSSTTFWMGLVLWEGYEIIKLNKETNDISPD